MLRKPDGQPERRSIDDQLKDAMSEEEWARLPGKGKRLDLRSYFQSGEEHRVANKILQGNGVLPQQLQGRKEIGRRQIAASTDFDKDLEALQVMRESLRGALQFLVAPLAPSESLASFLATEWPSDFPRGAGTRWPSRRRIRRESARTLDLQHHFRTRSDRSIERLRANLEAVNEGVEILHKDLIRDSRSVPGYPLPQPVDIPEHLNRCISRLPTIPNLPLDLTGRLLLARPRKRWLFV